MHNHSVVPPEDTGGVRHLDPIPTGGKSWMQPRTFHLHHRAAHAIDPGALPDLQSGEQKGHWI